MKLIATFISTILLLATTLFANNGIDSLDLQKQCFTDAKAELENMLSGKSPLDYERAVFVTENAYWNNAVDYANFESIIDIYVNNIVTLAELNRKEQSFKATLTESVEQQQEAYNKLLYNWAIYSYLTDTITVLAQNKLFYHTPCQYSTADPFGTLDWKNSQVFSLLNPYNKTANCYAQSSFFRILAERLNTDAQLGVAPGHTYITHTDPKGIHYNIELPTRSFPGAGSIMTLTYTPIQAVQNGIAMRTLDLKQSVALCLVYLAKGYEHKFNVKADDFVLQCAETALQYDPLNLNAMLLKAEVLEEKIIKSDKTVKELQGDEVFKEYQDLIASLYEKGYREMPLDMKNLIINRLQKDSAGLILTDHTPKGFQSISPKNDRYATLSWGTFDEVHEPKTIEQYGRTVFNTKTKKIIKFVAADSLYNNYQIDPVISAWQVDPMAAKYPQLSPYAFCADNPILFVDFKGYDFFAYGKRNQKRVIRVMNKTFGKEHGFSFENNKLVHSGYKSGSIEQSVLYNYFTEKIVDNKDVNVTFRGFNLEWFKVDGHKIDVGEGNASAIQRLDKNSKLLVDIGIGPNQKNSLIDEGVKSSKETAFWHEIGHPIATVLSGNDFSEQSRVQAAKWTVGFENVARSILGFSQRSGSIHGVTNPTTGSIVPGSSGSENIMPNIELPKEKLILGSEGYQDN